MNICLTEDIVFFPSARGRCRDPPSWSEGDVSCDDEAVGGGWEVGDMCRYSCPEGLLLFLPVFNSYDSRYNFTTGQIIFGARKATCTAIIDTVTNERDYVFIGGPPCCRGEVTFYNSRIARFYSLLNTNSNINCRRTRCAFKNKFSRIIVFPFRLLFR